MKDGCCFTPSGPPSEASSMDTGGRAKRGSGQRGFLLQRLDWTLKADHWIRVWSSSSGCLGAGGWLLDAGCWLLAAAGCFWWCLVRNAGCLMLGAWVLGCLVAWLRKVVFGA